MAELQPLNVYSKIPLLRPPFGLPKSGFISDVVLIKYEIVIEVPFGTGKDQFL